jgi:hypothetical protein
MELRYLRDTDRREVDFVVLKERQPLFAVECHLRETSVGLSIPYFAQRTPIPRFHLVHMGRRDYEHPTLPVRVCPFPTFVQELRLP